MNGLRRLPQLGGLLGGWWAFIVSVAIVVGVVNDYVGWWAVLRGQGWKAFVVFYLTSLLVSAYREYAELNAVFDKLKDEMASHEVVIEAEELEARPSLTRPPTVAHPRERVGTVFVVPVTLTNCSQERSAKLAFRLHLVLGHTWRGKDSLSLDSWRIYLVRRIGRDESADMPLTLSPTACEAARLEFLLEHDEANVPVLKAGERFLEASDKLRQRLRSVKARVPGKVTLGRST